VSLPMQDYTPTKDISEQHEAQKESKDQQHRVEMTPVRHAQLDSTPEGTPEQQRAEDFEAASPGFDPKTPERPPTK